MDILFEIIFDIIFEGSVELSQSKRVSKWIRIPLTVLLLLFVLAVIAFLFGFGIHILRESWPIALFFFAVSLLLTFGFVCKCRSEYRKRRSFSSQKKE